MARLTRQQRAELRKKALAHLKKSDAASAYVPLDDKNRPDVEVISSGSIVLDKVLGCGGWPRGRVVEIFGPESVGKTTVAIAACIEAQREGGFATYIDFEHALHLGYAQAMGLDVSEDAFAFFQPDYFEMGANIAYVYAKMMQSDIVVIDSVSAMIPKAQFEGQPDEGSKSLGLQARLMGNFLNQITKELPKTGTTLLFINQMRSNIKTSKYDPGPDWTTSGGKSLPYYCTIRLRLKPGKVEYANLNNELTGDKEKIPVSNFVRAEGHKNKVGFPKRKGEFCIRYGEGVDNCRSIIDVAERYKIIKKAGSWYEYKKNGEPGWLKRQGVEQFRKALLEKPDVFQLLASDVSDKLASSEVTKIKQDLSDDDLTSEDRSHMDFSDGNGAAADDVPDITMDDEDFDLGDLMADTPAPKNAAGGGSLLSLDDIDEVTG
jgi:recombination protein RecA